MIYYHVMHCLSYLLVGLEGSLQLEVVPVCQDEAEGGLICPEASLTSLPGDELYCL